MGMRQVLNKSLQFSNPASTLLFLQIDGRNVEFCDHEIVISANSAYIRNTRLPSSMVAHTLAGVAGMSIWAMP